MRIHDFGPEVAVFARKSGEKDAAWMRMDRFPGKDGKLAKEGVVLMHHPDSYDYSPGVPQCEIQFFRRCQHLLALV